MKALGVDILIGFGSSLVSIWVWYNSTCSLLATTLRLFVYFVQGPQKVKYGKDNIITAKDIIIATGSVPFVPKGIEVDGIC